jgi:hypothetical protein
MQNLAKLIRIEPVFDDPDLVRALFERHGPYRTIAEYIPRKPEQAAFPYFRGNWAVGGEPLVDGAETILHNHRFIDAAQALFGSSAIRPTFIVVNLNAPMPAGPIHVDVPTFRGATREQYPLGWLIAMGRCGLFERWRIVQAGAVSWFYDGPGGNFEYWPEGLDGQMIAEQPPFRNVAIMADNDVMYHRIGRVGAPNAPLPRMTAAAELLNLDRVMSILIADLRKRKVDFHVPAEPLSDKTWIATLDSVYGTGPDAADPKERNED